MEPRAPPVAQSPAQPHDGHWPSGTFQVGCGPTSCASLALPVCTALSPHPLWQLHCSSHAGRTACARHSREHSAHSCSARATYLLNIGDRGAGSSLCRGCAGCPPLPPCPPPRHLLRGLPQGTSLPPPARLGAVSPPQSSHSGVEWCRDHLQGGSRGSNPRGNGRTPADPSVCPGSSAHTHGDLQPAAAAQSGTPRRQLWGTRGWAATAGMAQGKCVRAGRLPWIPFQAQPAGPEASFFLGCVYLQRDSGGKH